MLQRAPIKPSKTSAPSLAVIEEAKVDEPPTTTGEATRLSASSASIASRSRAPTESAAPALARQAIRGPPIVGMEARASHPSLVVRMAAGAPLSLGTPQVAEVLTAMVEPLVAGAIYVPSASLRYTPLVHGRPIGRPLSPGDGFAATTTGNYAVVANAHMTTVVSADPPLPPPPSTSPEASTPPAQPAPPAPPAPPATPTQRREVSPSRAARLASQPSTVLLPASEPFVTILQQPGAQSPAGPPPSPADPLRPLASQIRREAAREMQRQNQRPSPSPPRLGGAAGRVPINQHNFQQQLSEELRGMHRALSSLAP